MLKEVLARAEMSETHARVLKSQLEETQIQLKESERHTQELIVNYFCINLNSVLVKKIVLECHRKTRNGVERTRHLH